jgi:hypothetical protein
LDTQVPPAPGPRAMLKAQLAAMAGQAGARPSGSFPVLVALAAAAALLAVYVEMPKHAERAVPSQKLTPGAVRNVAKDEVCSASAQPFVVPVALQRRVFEEYGIRNAPLNAYEVDYLITPELGGAEDIRNLWPEPYSATVWNAHVKDQLEERLHQLVCDGQLDLATAQHDIATDWIAAYKKYFNSDRPRQN